jgi:hypothetical protein
MRDQLDDLVSHLESCCAVFVTELEYEGCEMAPLGLFPIALQWHSELQAYWMTPALGDAVLREARRRRLSDLEEFACLRPDGSALLMSIDDARFIWFDIDAEELRALRSRVPGLMLTLEPLRPGEDDLMATVSADRDRPQ